MNQLIPKTHDQLERLAKQFAASNLVPKSYMGKPLDCLVAMQAGISMGLNAFQALQNIAVINGRPTIWGDALIGLVRRHPDCKGIQETIDGEGDERTATCTVKRSQNGEIEEITKTFSWKDAKRADLTTRGPWKSYPDRMLQMRARGFALRDAFSDAMAGVITREEVEDYPEMKVVSEPKIEAKVKEEIEAEHKETKK
jgi:hypothetical protein|tara:strand:+ start:2584 stop:3177 length:594 start_codon:yes stop_codon:yes gene_type:complete